MRRADRLRDRRVGLLSHQAAVGSSGVPTALLLRRALGDRLVALFGPEHGYFGLAGAGVATPSERHPDWGIPIHSLYGETRKPTAAMLRGVDLLVFDLQDLGVRCYTYLATLSLAMEACVETGTPLLVLDRPVPYHGRADGPRLHPGWESFVAPLDVPMAHGMTPGEAALWMARRRGCEEWVDVVRMEGYREGDEPTTFVPPSPGIATPETALTYPATVFSEALPALDHGGGKTLSFQLLALPGLRAEALCEAFTDAFPPARGAVLAPYRYVGASKRYAGRVLDGVRLVVTRPRVFRPILASLHLAAALTQLTGKDLWTTDDARPEWFSKLYGGPETLARLRDGEPPDAIARSWPRFTDRVCLYESRSTPPSGPSR